MSFQHSSQNTGQRYDAMYQQTTAPITTTAVDSCCYAIVSCRADTLIMLSYIGVSTVHNTWYTMPPAACNGECHPRYNYFNHGINTATSTKKTTILIGSTRSTGKRLKNEKASEKKKHEQYYEVRAVIGTLISHARIITTTKKKLKKVHPRSTKTTTHGLLTRSYI